MRVCFVPKNDIADDPVNRMRCCDVIKGLVNLGCVAGVYKGKSDYDILVILSLDFDRWLPILRENKRIGRLTIFDLSDNEFERAARLVKKKIAGARKYILNIGEVCKRWQFYKKRKIFDKGLYCFTREVDFVTVSSASIHNSVVPLNVNCCVIPDAIDMSLYQGGEVHRNRDSICIVWIGMPNNVIFLQGLNKVLCRLQQEFNLKVRIISSSQMYALSPFLKNKLKFKFEFIEWDLSTINQRLAEADIGIAPLRGDLWKSVNKVATYWAAGLPVVVSPCPAYEKVIVQGENGYVARSSGDWYGFLKELIINGYLRDKFASKGRVCAEKEFSIQTVSRKWLDLFEKLTGEKIQG